MINKILYTFLLLTIFNFTYSQDTLKPGKNWRLFPSDKQAESLIINDTIKKQLNYSNLNGKTKVYQDTRLDKIESELRDKPYIYGYTLQLEVSQQKNVIKEARYKILKISPDIELDDPYESPNIYLYAGRFYDRNSAYQYKNEISKYFPNAIVVGPKKMDLPVIKTPEPVLPIMDSLQVEDPRND
jgi:hypothetical protein